VQKVVPIFAKEVGLAKRPLPARGMCLPAILANFILLASIARHNTSSSNFLASMPPNCPLEILINFKKINKYHISLKIKYNLFSLIFKNFKNDFVIKY
jgi:hypothetical protein